MKQWFAILSAGLLAVLACTPATAKELHGQVFIVTKGGQSIKLALAKVYLLSLDDIAAMQRRAKVIKEELQKEEDALDAAAASACRTEQKRLEPAQAFFEERSRRHGEMFATTGDTAEWRNYKRHVEEAERLRDETRLSVAMNVDSIRAEAYAKIQKLRARAEEASTSPPEGVPLATLTDAEGEFTVQPTPAEQTHVLILAHRQEPAELYQWCRPLWDLQTAKGKHLFSNHNLRGAL